MRKLATVFTILAGASLTLAFAPFDYWLLAIIAPTILILLLRITEISGLIIGFIFGIAFFGSGVSWVYISIHEFGQTNIIVAGFLTLLLVFYLSLFPALFAYFSQKIIKNSIQLAPFVLPTLWIIIEWLRGTFLTGFPWLFQGYALLDSPLSGLIPIIGVYGVSWITIYLATIIVATKNNGWKLNLIHTAILICIFVASHLGNKHEWTKPLPKSTKAVLIQGNIPQDAKWQTYNQQKIITTYWQLTTPWWQKADLIIWPEAAITTPLPFAKELIEEIASTAKTSNTFLLTGIPILANQQEQYYNAFIILGGQKMQTYYKRHLVPFGEYLPLASLLDGLINFFSLPMSDFITPNTKQGKLIAAGLKIQPAICYEIAYPELVLEDSNDSNIILTLSNDTWFGNSLGPKQHMQIARFRAKELSRPLLRSTNSGITASVDHKGNVIDIAPSFQKTILFTKVTGRQGITPIMNYGHKLVLIFFMIISGLSILINKFLYRT